MREAARSHAVRMATETEFEQGVPFAAFEARLGRDVPSVQSRARGERVVRVARVVTHAAPAVALLAPLGTPGPFGIARPGLVPWMFYGESLERLAMVCFVLALSGQTWTLLTWWHLGRRRDLPSIISSAIALLVGVLWLLWLAPSPSIGGVLPSLLKAPVVTTVVLAALALGAQVFASQPGAVEVARAQARGGLMRVLPPEQQRSLLAERHEALEALLSRQIVDRSTADAAATLPLGDWWRLDAGRPTGPLRRETVNRHDQQAPRLPSSLANSNVALQCLKAVALVAPFGMMLLPIGNPGISTSGADMRSVMESEGFGGDSLITMALLCAMAGIIGQVWTLFDWWRLGRRRDGLWLASSWTALGSAVVTLVIFPFVTTGSWGMQVLTGPILAVAVSAAVALVALYAASVPGTVLEVREAGRAEDQAHSLGVPEPR